MENGKWARGSKQKADLFANHLENVFKPLPCAGITENIILTKRNDEEEIPPVTLKELRSIIRHNFNVKKAPGYDLINGRIMKELPDQALLKLQYIINACFKLKHVPKHWKIAEVIVIPKSGKPPTEIASYRPISLLPIMSKVFERLFLKRLMPIIQDRELIPTHQFGFRNKHSTIEQVHRITNIVEKALEEKKNVQQSFSMLHKHLIKYGTKV